jgi:hypothetical protein
MLFRFLGNSPQNYCFQSDNFLAMIVGKRKCFRHFALSFNFHIAHQTVYLHYLSQTSRPDES